MKIDLNAHKKVKFCSRKSYKMLFCMLMLIVCTVTTMGVSYGTDGDENRAGGVPNFSIEWNGSNPDGAELTGTLQILIVLTIISLAPSILVMMTSFTRLIVVLHFMRQALGTVSSPPNQVLIGLALFLTGFIMAPTFGEINKQAIQPLSKNQISYEQAFDRGMEPIRKFMLKHTRASDMNLLTEIAGEKVPEDLNDIKTTTLIPAFILSELYTAFFIGFLLYIPFIVIDMVVASTLMAMGMMMLPPTTISMPFKILLFIMADGWNLVIGQMVEGFM